jgi:hypothetical protein
VLDERDRQRLAFPFGALALENYDDAVNIFRLIELRVSQLYESHGIEAGPLSYDTPLSAYKDQEALGDMAMLVISHLEIPDYIGWYLQARDES